MLWSLLFHESTGTLALINPTLTLGTVETVDRGIQASGAMLSMKFTLTLFQWCQFFCVDLGVNTRTVQTRNHILIAPESGRRGDPVLFQLTSSWRTSKLVNFLKSIYSSYAFANLKSTVVPCVPSLIQAPRETNSSDLLCQEYMYR